MWFEKLTGFKEESPSQVRENILIDGNTLVSKINEKSFYYGELEISSLENLKEKSPKIESFEDTLTITELIGDVQNLHIDTANTNALFQAASQFNLLEMIGSHITPEEGVGRYEYDYTQGPACAIACGAGTIYRNYFVPLNSQIGQTSENQIDCLDNIGISLNNKELNLWKMSNGYALANQEGLKAISKHLTTLSATDFEVLKGKLKVGIQWDTEVTMSSSKHRVSQIYCSALPVAYSHVDSELWGDFASLILEATYEATLYASLINYSKTGCRKVYLTLVGGGAFGNHASWIKQAILKALDKFKATPLEISMISYGSSNATVRNIINEFKD